MTDQRDREQREQKIAYASGDLIGNAISHDVQEGSNAAMQGMKLFRLKGERLQNVGYEQAKGNLFEYIEGAKLNKNMANAGVAPYDTFTVTDAQKAWGGYGENTAPDDFRLQRRNKIFGFGQAKVNNKPHDTARNFANDKYKGMQRITTCDTVDKVKLELDSMVQKGEISRAAYNDAVQNLKYNGLTDPVSGVSSEGTTTVELRQFRGSDGKISADAVKRYANKFEARQYGNEIVNTSANMAAANFVVTGVVSGVWNCFDVLKNKKTANEAIRDVTNSAVRSGVRGGITGTLSSVLRIGGSKLKNPILTDSTAATVIAAGVVDSGVAVYEYAKGEINETQLVNQLKDTAIKSTATVYFTKAVGAVVGASSAFVPIAIYSVASYVVGTTRSIIENAQLNAAEYDRLAQLDMEMQRAVREYREQIMAQINSYEQNQRQNMVALLNSFDKNIVSGNNCDAAIYAIVDFANITGIQLQYSNFDDFSHAMMSSKNMRLR